MQLKIKKLHPDAIIPQYATKGAACFDLHAVSEGKITPAMPVMFKTGLSFEIPEGWVMLIFSRSGHGFNSAVRLSNCVGVIDSDYRGEVKVKLTCDDLSEEIPPLRINPGDRIAQALLVPSCRVTFNFAEELTDTARGAGGFGSTGK